MEAVFHTNHLLLRLFTINDDRLIYELNNDTEVTRYTHDHIKDLRHARRVLTKVILPQYVLYNHGRWAVHVKPGLEFIGWCGLKYRPELNEVDLGYRFMPSSWGKGYATEAAIACITYGFERLHIKRIVGRSEPANAGSIRVLEKCGMHFIREETVDGFRVKTYDIYNPLIP